MPIKPLKIVSSDDSLLRDLQAANIPGLSIEVSVFTCDSIDWVPPPEAVHILISAASGAAGSIALNMLSSWLYDRFVKKNPNKASVDNQSVVNNYEKVGIVINNYIQVNQEHFRERSDE